MGRRVDIAMFVRRLQLARNMKFFRSFWFWLFTAILLLCGIGGYLAFQRWVAGPWSAQEVTVELPPNRSTDELMVMLDSLLGQSGEPVLDHIRWRDWTHRLQPGRYVFPAHESVKQSAARLVTGQREMVNVVVPSGRDIGPIAAAASRTIFVDSIGLANRFSEDSVMWRIIPNTYECWWECDADGLVDRLLREHAKWWNQERTDAALDLGLTPFEVTVLASIVQAETAVLDEAPMVAGLYLNRLNRGMALQADPTLIYALGDPSIRRVLNIHKEVDSPYNTYLHVGLPPGPIRIVDPRYLESVLHPSEHTRTFTCVPNLEEQVDIALPRLIVNT